MTSIRSELAERLRRRLETEHQEIEKAAVSELRRLAESLSAVASDALRSTEADMAAATERMRALLLRGWLWLLAAGLSLSLGISGGSWATMRWLSASIEDRFQTLAILDLDIEQARETLTHLEETTWRVQLLEIDGERFVVLPAGSPNSQFWRVGGRPAVKLSGE